MKKFKTVKGMRDFLPDDAIQFKKLIEFVEENFKLYGFSPLITPAIESFELLSAKGGLGEAVKEEIYYFKDKAKRELGLRFDLTMPLARVVLNNPQLPKPFKRYQIGRVWRYDEPQALRWREFWQADIDIVGSSSLLADLECLACVCDILKKLGLKFKIRINNRKLMEVLLSFVPKKKLSKIFRIIDKKDKIGLNGIERELKNIGIESKKILKILRISGKNEEIIKKIEERFGNNEGLNELKEVLKLSKIFGIEKFLQIDLSLVRGLDYYTSLVYEIDLSAGVSCGGGGRYDNLIKNIGGQNLPATGISLGLDRIFEAVKKMKKPKSSFKVFIAIASQELFKNAVKIAKKLRRNNIICEFDLMNRNLRKQLEYANSLKIPFVIIVGKEELKKGKFKLKDMERGIEKELEIERIIEIIKHKK